MAAKFLIICVQAFFMQSVYSQCIGSFGAGPFAGPYGLASPLAGSLVSPLAFDGCGGVASTGGGFAVTSISPIAPIGVTVVSENTIEGALSVEGNLPLLGAVGLEGAFPTAGAGAVSYGCGDDALGITSEGPITTGILVPGLVGPAPALAGVGLGSAFAPGLAGPAFAPGLAGRAFAPGLYGAASGPGFFGGIAPGCGCGALY